MPHIYFFYLKDNNVCCLSVAPVIKIMLPLFLQVNIQKSPKKTNLEIVRSVRLRKVLNVELLHLGNLRIRS